MHAWKRWSLGLGLLWVSYMGCAESIYMLGPRERNEQAEVECDTENPTPNTCGEGRICHEGTCVTGCLTNNNTCGAEYACEPVSVGSNRGICVDVAECRIGNDSRCEDWQECRGAGNTGAPGTCTPACITNATLNTCGEGRICRNATCVDGCSQQHNTCGEAYVCKDNMCQIRCRVLFPFENDICPKGQSCRDTDGQETCQPGCRDDANCPLDRECKNYIFGPPERLGNCQGP